MKDIRGNEIKVGQTVHCIWKIEDKEFDILGTAVRTRGRGLKIISDDNKEYTTEFLESNGATIIIQEPYIEISQGSIKSDEINLVNQLKSLGWSGQLSKNFGSINIKIDM